MSGLLRGGRVCADDAALAVLVSDDGEAGRGAVVNDGPTCGQRRGYPLLDHLGCHVHLDVPPRCRLVLDVAEPEIGHPHRGVTDLVAR